MKMSKILIIDADQTILDFNTAFHQWMMDKGYETHDGQTLVHGSNLYLVYRGEFQRIAEELIEFSYSECFERLEPLEHALEAVKRLQEAKWTIHVVTSCDDHENTQKRRLKNLADLFDIQPSHVHFAGLLGSKTDILATLPSGFFVDDSLTHVREAISVGHKGILIHNTSIDKSTLENDIICASNWLEVERIVSVMADNYVFFT
jgi:FMN phosphatase YigB (HAD superfamily)